MELYSKEQLTKIVTSIAIFQELQTATEYIVRNAVAIIKNYGATFYNSIAYTLQEQTRKLEKITL